MTVTRLDGPPAGTPRRSRRRRSFVRRSLARLLEAIEYTRVAESAVEHAGFLQSLDARVKLVGIVALIVATSLSTRLWMMAALMGVALLLAVASNLKFRPLLVSGWISAFTLTGLVMLPAVFLTPGPTLYRLPLLHWPVSWPGLIGAAHVLGRVETCVTLASLLVLSTPWAHLLKALRLLGVPVVVVAILAMTYRYIFVLLHAALDMLQSHESRAVGQLEPSRRRQLAASSMGVLLGKALDLSHDVHLAMQARGFRGEVCLIDEFRASTRDWAALSAFAAAATAAFWFGR